MDTISKQSAVSIIQALQGALPYVKRYQETLEPLCEEARDAAEDYATGVLVLEEFLHKEAHDLIQDNMKRVESLQDELTRLRADIIKHKAALTALTTRMTLR